MWPSRQHQEWFYFDSFKMSLQIGGIWLTMKWVGGICIGFKCYEYALRENVNVIYVWVWPKGEWLIRAIKGSRNRKLNVYCGEKYVCRFIGKIFVKCGLSWLSSLPWRLSEIRFICNIFSMDCTHQFELQNITKRSNLNISSHKISLNGET